MVERVDRLLAMKISPCLTKIVIRQDWWGVMVWVRVIRMQLETVLVEEVEVDEPLPVEVSKQKPFPVLPVTHPCCNIACDDDFDFEFDFDLARNRCCCCRYHLE
jgi:hypothetical protein